MATSTPTTLDFLAQRARRRLWIAFALILMVGATALVMLAFPGSQAATLAGKLLMLQPFVIIFALAGMQSAAGRANLDPAIPGMKAVLNDELRQASTARAYRNGFFALLVAQPLFAMLFTWAPSPYPVAVMAGGGSLLGVCVFLGSLLYYDR